MHLANRFGRSRFLFRALGALFLGGAASALAQPSGTVVGQVSNAVTSIFLEGAEISVEGPNRTVLTDREGRFEFALPPGMTTLVVRYTGLETQRVTVTVKPGVSTVQNIELNSGIYQLDPYKVSGPREGSAYAITRQREAPNVKNVVASDSFGNIADGNIGDLLQQLPGITAVYVGADVRSVQIRGIDGALNAVTMDGDRIASSQSAGAGRTFEFEQASLNNVTPHRAEGRAKALCSPAEFPAREILYYSGSNKSVAASVSAWMRLPLAHARGHRENAATVFLKLL